MTRAGNGGGVRHVTKAEEKSMELQQDYERAPQEHLQTWRLVGRIMTWSVAVTVAVLALMAITLT